MNFTNAADGPVQEAGGRKGSKKARSGCGTCKKRKIKCDERKPTCDKCSRAKRKCEGYVVPRSGDRLKLEQLLLKPQLELREALGSLPDLQGDEQRRRFQFFRSCTKAALDPDSDYWSDLILVLCHREPAVCYAVLALGGLHESINHRAASPVGSGSLKVPEFVSDYCNKAINEQLTGDLSSSGPLVPLILCLLIICIESAQGLGMNHINSIKFLQIGRRILHDYLTSGKVSATQGDIIKEHIAPIYARAAIPAYLRGADVMRLPDETGSLTSSLRNVQHARYTFYPIFDYATCFTRQARKEKYRLSAPEFAEGRHQMRQLEAQRQLVLDRMRQWKSSFDAFVSSTADGHTTPGIYALDIYYHATWIWVATALATLETDYDRYTESFGLLLRAIRGYLSVKKTSAQPTTTYSFIFAPVVLTPLRAICKQCRHPQIRKAALDLMMTHRDRNEGLCNGRFFARAAARGIELEEEAARNLAAHFRSRSDHEFQADIPPPDSDSGSFGASSTGDLPGWPSSPSSPEKHALVSVVEDVGQYDVVGTIHSPGDTCSPPFGIPEEARLSDIIIEPPGDSGYTVTFFRKTGGPGFRFGRLVEFFPVNA